MKIEKLKRNFKIEARRSSLHGWGVFANDDIKKDEILEECHCLFLPNIDATKDRLELYAPLCCNVFLVDEEMDIVAIPFGLGCVYNSSNNLEKVCIYWEFDKENRIMRFFARRDIKKDTELLWNYHRAYTSWRLNELLS